ncbi:hypothetical protein CPB84DRAFT_1792465 [Gymnopilus junonius]|uniref:Aminoglycoside phosphotransferase domain-containing protein n=1 Tax=Gymnopilus junonius TaxID=109634 RepID=A0A9P5TIW8_GYMJU|nr:hypothetical protein CPB84DRAFT_1792465 [Gymnopilus junonius]
MSSIGSARWSLDLVKCRLKSPTTKHHRMHPSRSIAELPEGLFIKYGKHVHIGEGIAMRIARNKTSLPIPKVICMFVDADNEITYILETKLLGQRLGDVLLEMDECAQLKIGNDIINITTCLSSITPQDEHDEIVAYLQEPGYIHLPEIDEKASLIAAQSIRGGMIGRLTFSGGIFSQFCDDVCSAKSTGEFINWFGEIGGLKGRRLVTESVSKIDFDSPLIFSHGNLDVENILWKLTGVIDWEAAGWYPYFFDEWHNFSRSHMYQETGWTDTLIKLGFPCKINDLTPGEEAEYDASPVIAFNLIFFNAELFG